LRATKIVCPHCKEVFYVIPENCGTKSDISEGQRVDGLQNRQPDGAQNIDPSVQHVSGLDFYKALDEATSVR